MDRLLIKSLIDALAASDLAELEYAADGMRLRLVKAATRPAAPPPSPSAAPSPTPPPPAPEPVSRPREPADGILLAAPCFGIAHLHRTPGAPPLATEGQAVAAGEVLCLIEAMKTFIELRADAAGTIAAVLIATGQEVEAGQPLIRLRR